jgi:hypothetical protein
MSAIKIKASATGALVRTYTNNPEYGYVVLEMEELVFGAGWVREAKRTCLLRSKVNVLNKVASMATIPGRIQLQEFLENNIPADVAKNNLQEGIPFEEAISSFVKTAGDGGPSLKRDGKRILRFTSYDPSGQSLDLNITHDNVAEVEMFRKSQEGGNGANLPGGDGENVPF